jgi:hypothetical protein
MSGTISDFRAYLTTTTDRLRPWTHPLTRTTTCSRRLRSFPSSRKPDKSSGVYPDDTHTEISPPSSHT